MYEWDETKRLANIAKHGVDFADAGAFEWASAVIVEDKRRDYGERRFRATGFIGTGLYVLVMTRRSGLIRIISLRKAYNKDKRKWRM